jgi:hypothetical protein
MSSREFRRKPGRQKELALTLVDAVGPELGLSASAASTLG